MTEHCLIIEDNLIVAEPLMIALKRQGYQVTHTKTAEEALEHLSKSTYDMILLDLILPGMSGEEFIKTLRQKSDLPILVISEKNSDVGKAISLELGADDYITKPASIVELIARIKAILRRVNPKTTSSQWLEFKTIRMNLHAHEVLKNEEPLFLTIKEYDLLKLFLENPSNVLSKRQIYRLIWDEELFGNDNIINVHIRRLREKIEDDATNPEIVITVWGIGYRLGNK